MSRKREEPAGGSQFALPVFRIWNSVRRALGVVRGSRYSRGCDRNVPRFVTPQHQPMPRRTAPTPPTRKQKPLSASAMQNISSPETDNQEGDDDHSEDDGQLGGPPLTPGACFRVGRNSQTTSRIKTTMMGFMRVSPEQRECPFGRGWSVRTKTPIGDGSVPRGQD